MAIDTRDKRMSLFNLALPSGRVLPHRDGTVTEEDFEQLLFLYRGIQSGEPPEPTLEKTLYATLLFLTTNATRLRFFSTVQDDSGFDSSQERFMTFNSSIKRGAYF